MRQFVPYQIYVHGSFLNELAFRLLGGVARDDDGNIMSVAGFDRDPATWQVKIRNSAEWVKRIRLQAVSGMFDLIEDPSEDAKKYEFEVCALLKAIAKTRVGRCVFESLPKDQRVYIVRHNSFDELSTGVCNSTTRQGRYGGNVRISFNPDSACASEYASLDETLVHEMYHAFTGIYGSNIDYYFESMKESKTREEFLAVQVANMYRVELGAVTNLRRVYGGGSGGPLKKPGSGSIRDLEEYFGSEEDVYQTLIPTNPLLKGLAQLTGLKFNPFRDWKKYESAYLSRPKTEFQMMGKLKPLISPMR
ncbi:hypothetical protein F183_A03500 [Bryobacterales bacterium F-183]|nr:hypothetical protein F183_A03500 [Bryobacterales bacterium F-183]